MVAFLSSRSLCRPLSYQALPKKLLTQHIRRRATLAVANDGPLVNEYLGIQYEHTDHHHHHQNIAATAVPLREEFWRNIPVYENVSAKDFLSHRWSVSEILCHLRIMLPLSLQPSCIVDGD